jgi:4-carboxymuconolactone decarboxylase
LNNDLSINIKGGVVMSEFPKNYLWLESKFGKAFAVHQTLGKELNDADPIGEKNAHLIQLAAAAAIRSEGAVHSHVRRALESRVNPAEIYHALVLLTSTIGDPTVATALSWAKDIIENRKKDTVWHLTGRESKAEGLFHPDRPG